MGPTWIVLAKELGESMREAHVLTWSFGFPFLLLPALMWGASEVASIERGALERHPPAALFSGPPELARALDGAGLDVRPGDPQALLAGRADIAVSGVEVAGVLRVEITSRSTDRRSAAALDRTRDAIRTLRMERLRGMLPPGRGEEALAPPWRIEEELATTAGGLLPFMLSLVLPGLLHLSLLLGVQFPAVDVVTGEREQGTLETTLLAAVPRRAILAGKVGAVTVIGVVSASGAALAGLLMVLQLWGIHRGTIALSLSPHALVLAAPVLASTALLAATITVLAVLPTRSFKAGQNASTVVMLLGSALMVPGLLPSVRLSPLTALLPFGGSVLVARQALVGDLPPLPAMIVLAGQLLLAWAALKLGGRVARSESFLFGPGAAGRRRRDQG